MNQELAVVLVSGGMDSCVTAAIAAQRHRLAFLHVSYGQRTARRERKACRDLARFYRVDRLFIANIKYLAQMGGSALTDRRIEVPQADLSRRDVPVTYVPFRNTHLLAIAVSWGETIGANYIYIGAVAEDSSGYPDCRPEYYQAFNRLIEVGTRPETRIEVVAPVITMRKSEIVRLGLKLGAPLHLTWSCYKSERLACGECDSCALRLRAFSEAGVQDPIRYRSPAGAKIVGGL